MQTISASVGEGGQNKSHDGSLVQAMLMKIPRAPGAVPASVAFLLSYDGQVGPKTIAGIKAFQKDYLAVTAVPGAAALNRKDGQVVAGDDTWNKMLSLVPADFANMRVLEGGKTVYLPATAAEFSAAIADANIRTLNAAFRSKAVACITKIFNTYGMVVKINPNDGARRTFAEQDALLARVPKVTNAGPGESNHNYGQAADFGFPGLQWLKKDGTVTLKENPWLAKLSPGNAVNQEALKFWDVLRNSGIAVGLFRGPLADRPHLQSWSDAGVNMGSRLAVLLASSGTMKWSSFYSERFHYKTDMGLGGELVDAGTATQIWNENATISLAVLQKAWNDKAARDKAAPKTAAVADLSTMKKELCRQWQLADAKWTSWTPS